MRGIDLLFRAQKHAAVRANRERPCRRIVVRAIRIGNRVAEPESHVPPGVEISDGDLGLLHLRRAEADHRKTVPASPCVGRTHVHAEPERTRQVLSEGMRHLHARTAVVLAPKRKILVPVVVAHRGRRLEGRNSSAVPAYPVVRSVVAVVLLRHVAGGTDVVFARAARTRVEGVLVDERRCLFPAFLGRRLDVVHADVVETDAPVDVACRVGVAVAEEAQVEAANVGHVRGERNGRHRIDRVVGEREVGKDARGADGRDRGVVRFRREVGRDVVSVPRGLLGDGGVLLEREAWRGARLG